MKRIVLMVVAAIMVTMSIQAQRQISYIKQNGSWYQVYDESGKKITTLSKSSVGDIKGWGADFFVSLDGSWYKIYDSNGKKINTLSKASVGDVIGVSGNTFTSKDGGWIKIYDKTGKKIDTRSAQ